MEGNLQVPQEGQPGPSPPGTGRGSECGGRAGKHGSGGGTSGWYSPCLPLAQQYQLLPSHRASPADLEGPEPQGGQLGQMHPGVWEERGSLWWAASSLGPQCPPSPLSFSSFYAQAPFLSHLPLLPPPSSSSLAGLLGQPRGPLSAGSASLTLGPSVPGVPGSPRAPWRPWAPGEPRSPGNPRSPCGRDTKERLGQRDEVEARGEAGRWGAGWGPRTQGSCAAGRRWQNCTGRKQAQGTTRNGQQDTHSGTHEAGGSSFTGNALENKNV